jgi:hypothetical protein
MSKDQFQDQHLHLTSDEEVLEISSTGFGLESVSKKTVEKQKYHESKNPNPPGCGGL